MELIMKQLLRCVALLILLLSASLSANAENMKKLGTFNVHYMAIGATFLTPEVAKAYGIERSRYNGLINISVLDNSKKGMPAKTVAISGKAQNNIGQMKALEFEQVKEGNAIYYLAQIRYANEETVNFTIDISDGTESHQLKFSQQFFVD